MQNAFIDAGKIATHALGIVLLLLAIAGPVLAQESAAEVATEGTAEAKPAPAKLQTEEPFELQPGALLQLKFPDLPPTLAALSSEDKQPALLTAVLPENYSADRKFPIFLYLHGGAGGRGSEGDLALGRSVIGSKDYICVVMPLFKQKLDITEPARGLMVSMDDIGVISTSYRAMLEKLKTVVPNITSEGSVLGGHSNGAHTTGVLLAGQDSFTLESFDTFYLHEGGLGPLFANVLQKQSMKKPRFLVMIGGKGPFIPFGFLLERMTAQGGFKFTFVSMEGYGHEQPKEYLAQIGQWVRGEPLTLPEKPQAVEQPKPAEEPKVTEKPAAP